MTRIAISGRIYSDNLGDSAIMESSRYIAEHWLGATEVLDLDLDGKQRRPAARVVEPGGRADAGQSPGVRLHRWVYARSLSYGTLFNRLLHSRKRGVLRRQWADVLSRADCVLLGGGQLIQHSRMFFPLRIRELVRLAATRNVPVHVIGVGVGETWTPFMRRCYREALGSSTVKSIVCRDDASAARLEQELPELKRKISVLQDLAIVLPMIPGASREPPSSGIAIAPLSPNAARRIGYCAKLSSRNQALTYWTDLVIAARQRVGAERVTLFTTGTKEDLVFIHEVLERLDEREIRIAHDDVSVPATCFDLYSIIASHEAIVAGRLHASILAWSAGVHLQGLIWDRKVSGFAQSVREPQSFFSESDEPSQVVDKLLASNLDARPAACSNARTTLLEGLRDRLHASAA